MSTWRDDITVDLRSRTFSQGNQRWFHFSTSNRLLHSVNLESNALIQLINHIQFTSNYNCKLSNTTSGIHAHVLQIPQSSRFVDFAVDKLQPLNLNHFISKVPHYIICAYCMIQMKKLSSGCMATKQSTLVQSDIQYHCHHTSFLRVL